MRVFVVAIGCLLAFTASAPVAVRAEQLAPSGAAAASSDSAPPAPDMPGCPGKADGAPCCASCQEERAHAGAAVEKAGGCPCQRARRAKQAAGAPAQ